MVGLEAFRRPQTTIKWAEDAIEEIAVCADGYFLRECFQIVNEPEGDGVYVHKLVQAEPLPDIIPRRATEALNNLRNAFDQIVFAACTTIGRPVKKDAHFPWADNPGKDLQHKLEGKNPQQPKIPPEFWDIIRAHEPYPRGNGYSGGNDLIRDIARTANRKHTVGVLVQPEPVFIDFPGIIGSPGIEWVQIGGGWDPLKNELILARYKGTNVRFGNVYGFRFKLNFDVPPPTGEVNVHEALSALLDKAQSVLESFKQRCAELRPD